MTLKPNVKLLLQLDSSGKRTLAEAFVKGKISEADIKMLNEPTTFSAKLFAYNREVCIKNFVQTILPYMSDEALHSNVNQLCNIQTSTENENSSIIVNLLAKAGCKRNEPINGLPLSALLETLLVQRSTQNDVVNIAKSNSNPIMFLREQDIVASIKEMEIKISQLQQVINKIRLQVQSKNALLESSERGNTNVADPSVFRDMVNLANEKKNIFYEQGMCALRLEMLYAQLKKLNPNHTLNSDAESSSDNNSVTDKNKTAKSSIHTNICPFWNKKHTQENLLQKSSKLLEKLIKMLKENSLKYESGINSCYNKFGHDDNPKENIPTLTSHRIKLGEIILVQHILQEMLNDKEISHDMFKTLYNNKELFEKSDWSDLVRVFAFKLAKDATSKPKFKLPPNLIDVEIPTARSYRLG